MSQIVVGKDEYDRLVEQNRQLAMRVQLLETRMEQTGLFLRFLDAQRVKLLTLLSRINAPGTFDEDFLP